MEMFAAIVRADEAQRRHLAGARSDGPRQPPPRPRRPRPHPLRRVRAELSAGLIALGRAVAPPHRDGPAAGPVTCPVSPSAS